METLGQSEPYFVKCIRSNAEKVKCAPSRLGPHLTLLVFKAFFSSFEAWTFLNLFITPTPPLSVILFNFPPCSLFFPPSGLLSQLPLRFNDNLVLRQLRYMGMLETVCIRQSGYNIKYSFKVTHTNIHSVSFDHVLTFGLIKF